MSNAKEQKILEDVAERPARSNLAACGPFKLWPHQQEAVNGVRKSWTQFDRSLGVAPTGAGKTVIFADIAEKRLARGGRVLVLAHRDELISQAVDKLYRAKGLVASKEKAQDHADLDAGIVVASVQTLARKARLERFPIDHFRTVIVDECFPAGTLIDGRPIETLQTEQEVESFNHEQCKIERRRIVRLFKHKPTSLLRLSFSDGRQLVCTPNHPLFNGEVYVSAAACKSGDILYVKKEFPNQNCALHILRKASGSFAFQTCQLSAQSRQSRPEILLFTGMSEPTPAFDCLSDNGTNQSTICFGANEKEQPDVRSRDEVSYGSDLESNRPSSQNPGRQRQTITHCANHVGRSLKLANRICRPDQNSTREWISNQLQNRYRQPRTQSRHRNRRQLSLFPPRTRHQKIGFLSRIRLESIEVLESGSDGKFGGLCPDGFVYNLEVEGNHNYFAAGILAHNCHHVPAETYQRILRHLHSDKLLGVTATPDRNDARNLGRFFEDIAFEIGIIDLIKAGFLCPIKVRTVPVKIDISNVSIRAGDFSDEELAQALEPVLEKIAQAVGEYAAERKTLIFVPLIQIAQQFADILKHHGFAAEMVCGICPDRTEKLARFSSGETQILVNATLLTEGFDEPSIECVIILRPTKIRSFYAQMVGRGTRIHPGKENLLLLDFLWISRQHILAKPASLIAHDENEQAAIETILEEGNADGDIVGALDESRERALARQILAQRKLKGEVHDLLDIIDLCIAYKAPELESYAPTMHWHVREVTAGQAKILDKYRVDLSCVHDRGHASVIIDTIIRYQQSLPATVKQLSYLHYLGYGGELSGLSKPDASKLIAEFKSKLQTAGT
jgi:superfamily II DNA or RNA helicase